MKTYLEWLNPCSDIHYNMTSRWVSVLIMVCALATFYRICDTVFS